MELALYSVAQIVGSWDLRAEEAETERRNGRKWYQKYLFLAEHALSEEMILNEVRFRGSPTINFALAL